MIFEILRNTEYDTVTRVMLIIMLPVIILMSLSIHEFAHGIVSYGLGDPTAKNRGRLTLNPLKHIEPIGTLCMFLFGFGWAKPVPVDPRYYKKPKKGMALCGLAGPAVNLAIGVNAYAIYCGAVWLAYHPYVLSGIWFMKYVSDTVYVILAQIFGMVGYYNIILAVFNLLPIPPLDGSRLLYAFLPDEYYFGVMKYERVIMFIMLALLWIGVFDLIIDGTYTLVAGSIEWCVENILNLILKIAS